MRLAYRAYDRAGQLVADVIESASVHEATDQLRSRGLFVTAIKSATDPDGVDAASGDASIKKLGKSGGLKQLALFTRQLQVLIGTGTPLAQSLKALSKQARDANWRIRIERLGKGVEDGRTLSDVMEDQPEAFDSVYRSLIAAGESSGQLLAMLDRLASLTRKKAAVRSAIAGAMAYPILLIGVSLSVLMTMVIVVLPRFAGLFKTLDMPLPPTTAAMMWLSRLLSGYWWIILPGLFIAGVGGYLWLQKDSGKRFIATAVLRLPVVGGLARAFITAGIARVMGTLLEAKLPLLDAIALTRQTTGNYHYDRLLGDVEEAVSRGESMSGVLSRSDLFPPSIVEAVKHGEESGRIGPLLVSLADFQDEDNATVIKSVMSIIEPAILIFVGLVVAVIAISLFLPLFDMAASAGGS